VNKEQFEHLLRAAGKIVGDDQFVVIGSQSLHAKYPGLPDELCVSYEVDLYAKNKPGETERLNAIGVDSPFHNTHGFYADPVDEKTAILPRGWKGRLVNFGSPATGGVTALCLDPHDLAIAKYVARREKDRIFNRELVARGYLERQRLLDLLSKTPITAEHRNRISGYIEADFVAALK
jgi:hypothetical protein